MANGERMLAGGFMREVVETLYTRGFLAPAAGSGEDAFPARSLMADLSERHGLPLRMQRVSALPARGPYILTGSLANPVWSKYPNALENAGFP